MKIQLIAGKSLLFLSWNSSLTIFDYDSYLNNIYDGCQYKCDPYKTADVYAQPNCLQQCEIIEKTFRN